MTVNKGDLVKAMSVAEQCGQIASHLGFRIENEGLSAILNYFRLQGMSEASIQSVLFKNNIRENDGNKYIGLAAFKIACDLLAAEQDELHRPEDAKTYRDFALGFLVTAECK